jgi:hypothetical protein
MRKKPAEMPAKKPSGTNAPKGKKKPVARHLKAGQKEGLKIYNTGSLLGNYPPGFENDGRRLLAECPEFKLWELYHEGGPQKLETDEGIQRAEQKALLGIRDPKNNDGDDPSIKINRALALHFLLRFKELGCWEGALPTAKRLAESFVPLIEEVLRANDEEEANEVAERAGKSLKTAILTLRRKVKKKSSQKFPAAALLIRLAQGSFQYTQKRPRKSELQNEMERLGYPFNGKDSTGKWRALFQIVELDKLPE